MEFLGSIFWLFFLVTLLVPLLQQRALTRARLRLIHRIGRMRGTRVITLIHRQETMSLLGFPIVRFINIEDSERVLQAIRLTPTEMPIDLILHTPGGLVLASEQIATALARHQGKVTVMVPHYAMSGGTLVSLAADEILMDPNSVLGPVDPQVGQYPAASILSAVRQPNPNRDDRTLILADMAEKAIRQVEATLVRLLRTKMSEERTRELAALLSQGTWTHDYPIGFEEARALGLPVVDGLPREVYSLMALYPQPPQRRPTVEYVPLPTTEPEGPLPRPRPQPQTGRGGRDDRS